MKTISHLLQQSVRLNTSLVRSLWALCSLLLVLVFSSLILSSIVTIHKKCLDSFEEAANSKINLTLGFETSTDFLFKFDPYFKYIDKSITRIKDQPYVRFKCKIHSYENYF